MCRITFTKYYCTTCKNLLECKEVPYECSEKGKACQFEVRDLDGYVPAEECVECEMKKMIEEEEAKSATKRGDCKRV
jgi:hypothetical protein